MNVGLHTLSMRDTSYCLVDGLSDLRIFQMVRALSVGFGLCSSQSSALLGHPHRTRLAGALWGVSFSKNPVIVFPGSGHGGTQLRTAPHPLVDYHLTLSALWAPFLTLCAERN